MTPVSPSTTDDIGPDELDGGAQGPPVAEVQDRPAQFDETSAAEGHPGDRMQHRDPADREDRHTGPPQGLGDRPLRAHDEGLDDVPWEVGDQILQAGARPVGRRGMHHVQHSKTTGRHRPSLANPGEAVAARSAAVRPWIALRPLRNPNDGSDVLSLDTTDPDRGMSHPRTFDHRRTVAPAAP